MLLVLPLTWSPISHQPLSASHRPESVIPSKATSNLGPFGLKLAAVAMIGAAIACDQRHIALDRKSQITVSADICLLFPYFKFFSSFGWSQGKLLP